MSLFNLSSVVTEELNGENELSRQVGNSVSNKFKSRAVAEKALALKNMVTDAEGVLTGSELTTFKAKAAKKYASLLDEL